MPGPKVALVFPGDIRRDSFFGFLLPSMALERLGAAVEDISRPELFDGRFENDLVSKVESAEPEWVAVNVKTTLYSARSYDFADAIRGRLPDAKIVMGGLHATACPEEALQHCDFVVRGDGEEPFRSLVAGQAPADIPGVVFRRGEKIFASDMARPPVDMDYLRPPARHLRKPHYRYSASGLIPMDLLETSRGCTHACSFCSPASVHPGRYRCHSPGYVMEEIARLDELGARYCMLTDDHFGGDLGRTSALCDLILDSGIRIAFFCFIRPFTGHMDIKRKMVDAGFVLLSYGAESPSEAQLKRYGKGYPEGAAFIRRVNEEWLEAGACYIGNSYVFGDVDDPASVLESLGAYARGLDPTYIEPLYSQPYPGTRYRKELKEKGLLLDKGWEDFTEGRLLVSHPEVDEDRMRRLRAKMWVDFFSPRKAAGIFRVPLYLHHHIGIPVITVLRYMKACDYSLFGCVLEDRFYEDLHVDMVKTYFRETINSFEPKELDATGKFDEFTDMLRLGFLKRLLGNRDVLFQVIEGDRVLASIVLCFEDGRIYRVHVVPGGKRTFSRPSIRLPLPLLLFAHFLDNSSKLKKVASFCAIVLNCLLFDLPRKALSFFI